MRAEDVLLCACASRRARVSGLTPAAAADGDIDWDTLLRDADAHGVTELLLEPLASGALQTPPDILARLERRAIEATAENLKRISELADLLRLFSDHGIRALTFKGPTLAAAAYGHPGRRLSSDIDLFVHRHDVSQIRTLLVARGYRVPPRETRLEGSLLGGRFPAAGRDDTLLPGRPGQTMVDVHVAFASWRYGIHLETRALFARAITVDVAGHRVATLCPDDLLLVLAIHGLMHSWSVLRLVSDIDAVAALAVDWDAVTRRAEAAGMRRVLWVALLLARRLLGTELPPHIVARASADSGAMKIVHGVVARLFDSRAPSDVWRLRPFLRCYPPDSLRRRIGFYIRDSIYAVLNRPWNAAYHSREGSL